MARYLSFISLLLLFSDTQAGSHQRCPRGEYPYMQLQVFACSRYKRKPERIVLDKQNYDRLRGELERCVGHRIEGKISLCGIPVVPTPLYKGKELST